LSNGDEYKSKSCLGSEILSYLDFLSRYGNLIESVKRARSAGRNSLTPFEILLQGVRQVMESATVICLTQKSGG